LWLFYNKIVLDKTAVWCYTIKTETNDRKSIMKRVLISTVVSRWIEVPDDADSDTILYETDGLFDGIDLDLYDASDFEIVEEESA
jgi:hypothetical protein